MKMDNLPDYSGKYIVYDRQRLIEQVQMQMSEKRFKHVLGVEEMAVGLAAKYDVSVEKASIAALTHDYAKERPDDEMKFILKKEAFDLDLLDYGNQIWHGIIGAFLVQRELGIQDPEILSAIRLHTTGAKVMTSLDKVIYVADYVELGRNFPGVEEAREIALMDLDKAVAYETKHTLMHLIEKEKKIYPKTIETFNAWVANE